MAWPSPYDPVVARQGNSLSPELNHERTARALENMILGDRGFRIYQVAHRNSGYSFRVVCS